MLTTLILTLPSWETNTLDGLSPGWLVLAAALFCRLPGIGVVNPQTSTARPATELFSMPRVLLGMVSPRRQLANARLASGTKHSLLLRG